MKRSDLAHSAAAWIISLAVCGALMAGALAAVLAVVLALGAFLAFLSK